MLVVLGADFLNNFKLLVDVSNKRLLRAKGEKEKGDACRHVTKKYSRPLTMRQVLTRARKRTEHCD